MKKCTKTIPCICKIHSKCSLPAFFDFCLVSVIFQVHPYLKSSFAKTFSLAAVLFGISKLTSKYKTNAFIVLETNTSVLETNEFSTRSSLENACSNFRHRHTHTHTASYQQHPNRPYNVKMMATPMYSPSKTSSIMLSYSPLIMLHLQYITCKAKMVLKYPTLIEKR